MVKEIPLNNGYVALVDDADYEFLMQWKWRVSGHKHWTLYAKRSQYIPAAVRTGKNKAFPVAMHNVLMHPPAGYQVDHINHNGLDNRRENLRIVTQLENMRNRRGWGKATTSKYKGVCWHKKNQYWQAQIKVDYKAVYLGVFDTPEEAALAYNAAAIKYFGDYACLNDVKGRANV